MQHDEVIWQVINQHFCSFKVKTQTLTFCKNPYNVSGVCNRQACPLANSRYATIVEDEGKCHLVIKTIERAHTPKNLWEKIPLSKNYSQALATIDAQLEYFPKYQKHKCKQRLTKIHQYLIRMRKMKLKVQTKIVGINKHAERREKTHEAKAEKAARLTDAISKELLERLKTGTYAAAEAEMMAYLPTEEYAKVMDVIAEENEDEQEIDEIEEDEGEVEYVEGNFYSDQEMEDGAFETQFGTITDEESITKDSDEGDSTSVQPTNEGTSKKDNSQQTENTRKRASKSMSRMIAKHDRKSARTRRRLEIQEEDEYVEIDREKN